MAGRCLAPVPWQRLLDVSICSRFTAGADYGTRKDLSPPISFGGVVVKGFGRGSKDLGIPTANLPLDCLGTKADALDSGIYFGWATVDGKGPYQMVMSVGW